MRRDEEFYESTKRKVEEFGFSNPTPTDHIWYTIAQAYLQEANGEARSLERIKSLEDEMDFEQKVLKSRQSRADVFKEELLRIESTKEDGVSNE